MSGSLATNLDANGNGLTALDYRRILQGFYPNPGIVSGGTVTGNSSLTYHVAPTVAVIDRGSDGTRLVYYAGGDTPAVAAGDTSNRRIDVIWLKANDPALDGGSNEVIVGVTQGIPAANPVAPTLDSGQLALMEKLVQPGATNLSTGSGDNRSYDYAIPYGGSVGLLTQYWDTRNFTNDGTQFRPWYEMRCPQFYIPTDRLVDFVLDVNFSAHDNTRSEWGVTFQDNGTDIPFSSSMMVSGYAWENHKHSFSSVLQAGWHSIRVKAWTQSGSAADFHYGVSQGNQGTFIGRRIQVWDRGVAK